MAGARCAPSLAGGSMTLEQDLQRWESGALELPELERAHPDSDVQRLIDLHDQLSAVTKEAAPLDEGSVTRMLSMLPERTPTGRVRRPVRAILLGVAAALLTASVALAVPAVREGMSSLPQDVRRLII